MVDLDSLLVAELERIAPARPSPAPRWAELKPRRRGGTAAAAAAAALAGVVALAIPWQHGPAALSPADAARVVRRTAAALAPRAGVLHIRLHVTVASPYHPRAVAWSGDEDHWVDERGAQSFRVRTTFPNLRSAVEVGGDYRGVSPTYVYDPTSNTLYSRPATAFPHAFTDPIEQVRRDLAGGTGVTVTHVGATYRIEDDRDLRRQTVLIVDAKTFRPIREIATIAAGAPFAPFGQKPNAPLSEEWQTVSDYRVFEYVSDDGLASIRTQHPHAKIRSARRMPPLFRRRYRPWTG